MFSMLVERLKNRAAKAIYERFLEKRLSADFLVLIGITARRVVFKV